MAENTIEEETTLKPANALTKKDVRSAFWRWTFFSHANYNYERLQATGVINAFTPILKKLYNDDEQGMKDALNRHLQFFNTEPSFGGPILSATIAMEEEKANPSTPDIPDEAINGFKTGLMGPLAGIGDTLWQGTLIPILLSFTIPFGAEGNIWMGPIAFFVLHLAIMLAIAYYLWGLGYEKGQEGIVGIMETGLLDTVMTAARTLGGIVIGALAAQFVQVSTPLKIPSGDTMISVQTDILDTMVEGLLPLSIALLAYYLIRKKFKPTTVLAILFGIGVVFGGLGIIL